MSSKKSKIKRPKDKKRHSKKAIVLPVEKNVAKKENSLKIFSNKILKTKPVSHLFYLINTVRLSNFFKKNKRKIFYVLALIVFIFATTMCYLRKNEIIWLVQSSVSVGNTYQNLTVLGNKIGGLTSDELTKRLTDIKSKFEKQKFTLTNGKNSWQFDFGKLGISFDEKAVSKSVMNLNKLGLADKYKFLIDPKETTIVPTIIVDNSKCMAALSMISIATTDPKDASYYFDQNLKVNPDQSGSKYVVEQNCQKLSGWLADNKTKVSVSLELIAPNITKSELEVKSASVNALIGRAIILKHGDYELNLSSEKILSLLDITKGESGINVSWSSDRLDGLINTIADNVNTYNGAPAVGYCQYVISNGGSWLDKDATKKLFTDLNDSGARTFDLPVAYHAPSVGTRGQVAPGNKTIYLTFDDGLRFGNQVMDYAACYGVKVTFFELGTLAAGEASVLQRAVREGHAVQSHGYEHALFDYGSRSYDWQYNDIQKSIDAITSATGVRPTYFRPPGGNRSSLTYDAAAASGVNLILWGVSSGDGANIGASTTCSNVLARAFDGATVLLHSSKADTTAAVPCIIEGLAARGYTMRALR